VARTDRLRTVARRIRGDDGFGLIELVFALSVLAIALLGLLATFSTGYLTLTRAGERGTATALADKAMESYRGKRYAAIAVGTTTSTYSGATSPDGRLYTVVATVTAATATNTSGTTARAVKLVTVTVADATGRQWVREASTFGQPSS
jgi:prepilin-type N-terminal cleavage/methylation domain-containing protein